MTLPPESHRRTPPRGSQLARGWRSHPGLRGVLAVGLAGLVLVAIALFAPSALFGGPVSQPRVATPATGAPATAKQGSTEGESGGTPVPEVPPLDGAAAFPAETTAEAPGQAPDQAVDQAPDRGAAVAWAADWRRGTGASGADGGDAADGDAYGGGSSRPSSGAGRSGPVSSPSASPPPSTTRSPTARPSVTSPPPTTRPPASRPPTSRPPTSRPPTTRPPTTRPPTTRPPTTRPPSTPPPSVPFPLRGDQAYGQDDGNRWAHLFNGTEGATHARNVRRIQARLGHPLTGRFSSSLRAQVLAYEQANAARYGLVVDGAVGPLTWAALLR